MHILNNRDRPFVYVVTNALSLGLGYFIFAAPSLDALWHRYAHKVLPSKAAIISLPPYTASNTLPLRAISPSASLYIATHATASASPSAAMLAAQLVQEDHINIRELLAIIAAFVRFSYKWKGYKVILHTDSTTAY